MDERRVVVLRETDEDDLPAVARAIESALGAPEEPDDDDGARGPIAVPFGAESPARLSEADVAIVLDAEADALARDAGVATRVAVFPRLALAWDGPLDADLVLVPHEALMADAVAAGAPRARVDVVGLVAPEGWTPAEDREAAKGALELEGAVVVVRAEALVRDDLAPALVQLSLVKESCTWLFDVGRDPDLAAALRRRVPGYGLDALMFADGEGALASYQAADLVLGRLGGPEVPRARAVGARLALVAPRASEARLAHRVEMDGLAHVADAPATLAVTVDAALADDPPPALVDGAARVVERIRGMDRGASRTGLPRGLERLDAPGEGAPRPTPARRQDDADAAIEDELAALREKLGL